MKKDDLIFGKADANDASAVLAMYKSVVGRPMCTWDEEYPGEREIAHDTETGNLFVLRKCRKIMGAVSIVPENELDDLPFQKSGDNGGEIARVIIARDFQGKGYSEILVSSVLSEMKALGYDFVRLAVAEINVPAQKTYFRLGFVKVGEHDMYGSHYFICDKKL